LPIFILIHSFKNSSYIYSYTDHLGNVCLSYFKNAFGSAEVLEENNFYPFGLKHEGYNAQAGNPSYNYQYNGKELQRETGWSDYGARMYMADIGRWSVIDPLSESSRRFTPYNYAYNNPIRFIDPDGRKPMSSEDEERNVMRKNAPDGSLWFTYANGEHGAGGGDGMGDFFAQMRLSGGGGGGSTTIGSLMRSVGITLGSLESFMQMNVVLNLRQQFINAGFEKPEEMIAKFEDVFTLVKEIPSLSELYKITNPEFINNLGGTCPNKTEYNRIWINTNNAQNILKLGYVVGHEMNHSFADLFFRDKFSEITNQSKSTIPFRNSFGFFQEVMGLSWEIGMGSDRYGNRTGFQAAVYLYGPEGLGYNQKSVDTVNRYLSDLKAAWNFMYKSKLNK